MSSPMKTRNASTTKAAEQDAKQIASFIKWVNVQFRRAGLLTPDFEVTNIETDFKDGTRLIKLMSLLTPEIKVPKYCAKPKMEIQCRENLNSALHMFEEAKLKLTGVGSDNILAGDQKRILGLLWTLIYAVQIGGIKIPDDSTSKSGKDGLLLWLQKQTAGYPNVDVKDFTFSFRDGLALAALINKYCPELIDFEECRSSNNPAEIVEKCFSVAEKELNIPRLLEVDDMIGYSDEKINMCYLSEYYNVFSKLEGLSSAVRRVQGFVAKQKSLSNLISSYEGDAKEWMQWADKALVEIKDPNKTLASNLLEARKQMSETKNFRQNVMKEKKLALQDLQKKLGTIQLTGKAHNRRPYTAPENITLKELFNAWDEIEEHMRKYIDSVKANYLQQKDKLVEQYAKNANGLADWISNKEKELASIKGDLPTQFSELNKYQQSLQDNELLDATKKLADELQENEIPTDDVQGTPHGWWELVWRAEQLRNLVSEKKAAVEAEITAKSDIGLAPEKIEELRNIFDRFDTFKNKKLSLDEFHNCVRGLGLDLTFEQVEALFNKHRDSDIDGLPMDAFLKVMYEALGDVDTKDQIITSFKALAKGQPAINKEQLAPAGAAVVDFCLSKMAPIKDGLDYNTYLTNVFVE